MHPPLSTPLIGLCISLSCLWNYFIAEAPSNPLLNRPKIKFLFSGANRFMVGHNGLYIIGLNRGGGGGEDASPIIYAPVWFACGIILLLKSNPLLNKPKIFFFFRGLLCTVSHIDSYLQYQY